MGKNILWLVDWDQDNFSHMHPRTIKGTNNNSKY